MHVAYGHGSVFLWRRWNTLRTSGFVDSSFFLIMALWRRHVNASALLQCEGRANAPAAWCWLYPVLNDGERQDKMSPLC